MLKSAIAYTDIDDATEAGCSLGRQIAEQLSRESPDAVVLFASAKYEYKRLLSALDKACYPRVLVGCSSAGEFISGRHGERSACAIALRSSDIWFNAALGQSLRNDRIGAAKRLVGSFQGLTDQRYACRSALVLTDALAGYSNDLVEDITVLTGGTYQFFGGGAGDDAKFSRTHVFYGTEAFTDAVVALEILSNKPLGIGVAHGWRPASQRMRVTESKDLRLMSVNGVPMMEAYEDYAQQTEQALDRNDPTPFFLHNVIGIKVGDHYRLSVPLNANPDGSVTCASDVPEGVEVCFMNATGDSTVGAASAAVRSALAQLEGLRPHLALFFDCVATRLRIGKEGFDWELHSVQEALWPAKYAGCNTYGQIARAVNQFSGFHNCTAVVCIIPE